MAMYDDSIELEEPSGLQPIADNRPRMPEPLPVRIVAIEDVKLAAAAGLEVDLDRFYVGILEFVRDVNLGPLVYRSDNFAIHFEVVEVPPRREEYRFVKIEVRSLVVAEQKLLEQKREYLWQRTLVPGEESIVVLDPAGNFVELVEYRNF